MKRIRFSYCMCFLKQVPAACTDMLRAAWLHGGAGADSYAPSPFGSAEA